MKLDWTQLAAMVAVLAFISTAAQLLLNRLVVQPALDKAVKTTMTEVNGKLDGLSMKVDSAIAGVNTKVDTVASGVKVWAVETFPSKSQFERHTDLDVANHGEITRALDSLVRDQDADHTMLNRHNEDIIRLKLKANL